MKFVLKLLCVSLAVASLAGCTVTNEGSSSPTSETNLTSALTTAGDGLYVTTDAGIYELQTVFPDSANLFYTDVNTKQRIFLCANPNCTHADESCPSYISTPSTMFPPMLLRVGDQLLVVFSEATDSSNPYAMLMNMDGSDRRTVFELSSNQYIQGGFCTTGNDLYFDLYEIGEDGDITYQLWYANFESGICEKVMDLGSGDSHYSLCDCTEDMLCLNYISPEGISYCMYDPQSNIIQEPFYVDNSASGNSLVRDGYLFALNEQNNSVQRISLTDNEEKSATFTVKESFGAPSMRYLFDGNLMITETQMEPDDNSYDMCAYILDFETGDCTEFTLQTPYNNRPVYVLTTIGDLCYVATDYTTYPPVSISEDGTVSNFDYVANIYAFVTKQDYVNSNSSGYQMVDDAFE